jgi:carboxylesterase type B
VGVTCRGREFGTCHGLEIPFLFWQPGQDAWVPRRGGGTGRIGPRDPGRMGGLRPFGDPNSADFPEWPRYDSGQRAVMNLAMESQVLHDPGRTHRTDIVL